MKVIYFKCTNTYYNELLDQVDFYEGKEYRAEIDEEGHAIIIAEDDDFAEFTLEEWEKHFKVSRWNSDNFTNKFVTLNK